MSISLPESPAVKRCNPIAKALSAVFLLAVISACATLADPPRPVATAPRPADGTMNSDAGRGAWLFVTLRMEDGTELLFIVDTGTEITCIDKPLLSKLGAKQSTFTGINYGDPVHGAMYPAPKLFLGGAPLQLGNMIAAIDLAEPSELAGQPIMGILGMDCLQHYCIQLDFAAGKMRFLDPDSAQPAEWGEAIPVTFPHGVSFVHRRGLMEGTAHEVLIDTGNAHDGDVELAFFQEKVREHVLLVKADQVAGKETRKAWLPRCEWDGAAYTSLQVGSGVNSIGLRFLARHLVTFNFPKQVMYLKRTSGEPLFDPAADSAATFLRDLAKRNELPGWQEGSDLIYEAHPDFRTYEFRTSENSATCHYRLIREEKERNWQLQAAWRTDEHSHIAQTFSL